MKLTKLERRRRSLYRLTFDNGGTVEVDVRTLDASPYREGACLTPAQLEELLAQSRYNRAHERALYLLGLRDYSAQELAKKLLTEATPEEAERVVARLQELGLLDDQRYARQMANSLSTYRQYPRRRVEQELRRRGVEADLAHAAVEELESEDFQLALALIKKKYYNKLDSPESRQRVAAALARRGFSYGAVRRAMEEATCGQETDSEEFEDTWQ